MNQPNDSRSSAPLSPPPDPHEHPPTRYAVPAGAVDAHAHIVGDGVRQPYVPERSFTPVPAPPEDYLAMLDATEMTYGVLVQVSAHATDNSLMVDTLEANPGRLRGIAVAPYDLPDSELAALKDAGVVGLRLNTVSGGGIGLDHLTDYDRLCQELGWHLQFLAQVDHLERIADRLSNLSVPCVIDNMGFFDVHAGIESPAWKQLLKLAADGAWVKLDGVYRLSQTPRYADAIPFAQSLLDVAPDRCVWGSDWPHVGFWGPMPNVGDLLDVLADWAPDPAVRNAVLVDNPHALYGFGGAS
jgi:predicted TIM-barrel fold metal-dependent hydrolase